VRFCTRSCRQLDTGCGYTRCWSYRVSTPIGADTDTGCWILDALVITPIGAVSDTGCWILDAGLCGSGSKRPMRRSTETDIAVTPALPRSITLSITTAEPNNTGTTQHPASSIEHHSQQRSAFQHSNIPILQHSNRRAQQHRHYPASSIQYRASLTAKTSIPTAASSIQYRISRLANGHISLESFG